MQDNIRVTTPIQNNDLAGKIRPNKDAPLLNPIDPSRVNAGNNAENSQNTKNDGSGLNYLLNQNSVYNKFVQQLVQSPGLAQTLKKVLFEAMMSTEKPRGLSKETTVDTMVKELAGKLNMEPQQIVEALKYQSDNQTKYSGKMFEMLRNMMIGRAASETQEYETVLGHFLKAYNGYFSIADTLKAITQNLKSIAAGMPASYQEQLLTIADKLITSQPDASLDLNLSTLKEEVIPFLSSYISKTNDFGRLRDTVTLLINNIARLNTSSKEEVVTRFVDLMDFCKFHYDLPDDKIAFMKNAFAKQISQMNRPENDIYSLITKLISEGTTSPEQSATGKAVFRDIMNTLLLDNSVFMPLTHLFLPVNYQGTFMFSEVWIDKNAKQKNPDIDSGGAPTTKVFVTFDIKGLGYFETTILLTNKLADVELSCPEGLKKSDREIKNTVAQIIAKNGFTMSSVAVSKGQPPKPVYKVFDSLYDARRGIDVTV